MSAIGTYFTTASPQVLEGLLMQAETRIRIGTLRFWGSLEVLSQRYTSINASVGLQTANSFDLGQVSGIKFEHVPSYKAPDVSNVLRTSLQVLESEETTIGASVYQFDIRLLELAVGTGVVYTTGVGGNERQMTVGGACQTVRRPMEIAAENIGCTKPSAPTSVLTGVSAIVITVYDAQCTSGLPWSDIIAGDLNTLDLEWTAYSVPSLANGNKIWNLVIY